MRRLSLLLLLLVAPVWATAPPRSAVSGIRASAQDGLYIDGEVIVVVIKLPFKVVCPEVADLYFWTLPSTWKTNVSPLSKDVEVTLAPEGTSKVSLVTIRSDWEAKKNVVKTYVLTVNVGKVPDPPTPPIPPVPPVDALTKQLVDAYAKDTDANKDVLKTKLSTVYKLAADKLVADVAMKTVKDIDAVIRATSQDSIGLLTIPNTRDAISKWTRTQLPTKLETLLDDPLRAKMRVTYAAVATSLEAVK